MIPPQPSLLGYLQGQQLQGPLPVYLCGEMGQFHRQVLLLSRVEPLSNLQPLLTPQLPHRHHHLPPLHPSQSLVQTPILRPAPLLLPLQLNPVLVLVLVAVVLLPWV